MAMTMIVILVVFLVGVYFWMNRKPAVAYRPAREDVLILLRKVQGGMNGELEWTTFIGVPIEQDAKLEEIRKKCAAMNENTAYFKDLRDGFLFNEQGLMEIRGLIADLESYVKSKGREKTDFQVNCAQMLEHKMDNLGLKFASWEYKDGQEESYYVGEFKGIEVYIYADGAAIKSPWGSAMYERPDYKSENDLTRTLMSKFTELISNPALQKN